jgi:hypothetical protein
VVAGRHEGGGRATGGAAAGHGTKEEANVDARRVLLGLREERG